MRDGELVIITGKLMSQCLWAGGRSCKKLKVMIFTSNTFTSYCSRQETPFRAGVQSVGTKRSLLLFVRNRLISEVQ